MANVNNATRNAARSTNAKARGPKAADAKGFQGHALAAQVLEQAKAEGELLVRQLMSRKQIMEHVMQFRDNAEHIAFRQDLTSALDGIKKEAEAAKLSLNAYTDANPIAATVRVSCSRWTKMSEAVEKGYSGSVVDLSKPWADIEKGATEHLAQKNQSTGSKVNAGPKQKTAGRKAKPMMAKVEEFIKTNLRDPKTNAPLPKDNRNLAEVVSKLLEDATLEETMEVAAAVQRTIEIKTKLKAEADAKIAAASDKAKDMAKEVNAAATKTRKGAAGTTKTTEHASAKESNRKQGRYSNGRVPL